MEHMDFTDIENFIPQEEPAIQIGPISIWIKGISIKSDNPDQIVLGAPFLYKTAKVRIYSAGSNIMGFELIRITKDLSDLYEDTRARVTEINFDNAEFMIKLSKDAAGRIEVKTTYWAWGNEGSGNLVFKDRIDQTYLPNIIRQVNAAQSFLGG